MVKGFHVPVQEALRLILGHITGVETAAVGISGRI